MIIWIASYPKSGNTWIRSFITSYYFTENGVFDPKKLANVPDYPNQNFFSGKVIKHGEIYKFWDISQKKIANEKKVRFLKTHNALINAHGKEFANPKYSLGAIYVVRDPRNVITSIKNHWDFSDYESALKFMMDKNTYVWGFNNNFSKSQIITSWKVNYLSWNKFNKNIKTILVRYEDLILNPESSFREIINFINQITNQKMVIDEEKFNNAINTTNFKNMQKIEDAGEFKENVYSEKTLKLRKFFHLGPNNDWKKILDNGIINKINKDCIEELKKLNYEL